MAKAIPTKAATRTATPGDRADRPRASRCLRIAAAHSPKFQAVTVPTTAANWWLFRVACQLSRLKARNSRSRNGLGRQPSSTALDEARARVFLGPRFDL